MCTHVLVQPAALLLCHFVLLTLLSIRVLSSNYLCARTQGMYWLLAVCCHAAHGHLRAANGVRLWSAQCESLPARHVGNNDFLVKMDEVVTKHWLAKACSVNSKRDETQDQFPVQHHLDLSVQF